MESPVGHATQCTSCSMFLCFKDPFEGEFRCCKCRLIDSLEARIKDLESQLAITDVITNMETELKIAQPTPAGASVREDPKKQDEDEKIAVRKRGRGKSAREQSPELVHPNKYARLQDIGETTVDLTQLDQRSSPSSQEKTRDSMEVSRGDVTKRQVLVVGDSIIRRTDSVICQEHRECRTVSCLPGARVRHIADRIDRMLGGAGEDPAVMVHVGTNDKIKGSWSVLKNDFRNLGDKLRKRTSKVVFSEVLPVPRATQERQGELRKLNKWLV